MKTKWRIAAVTVGCLLFLSLSGGCQKAAPPASSETPAPTSELTWLIACETPLISKSWSSYDVLSDISTTVGVFPQIEKVQQNRPTVLANRLLAGDKPDLITVSVEDTLVLRLANSGHIHSLRDFPAIRDLIPESVRTFHQVDGQTDLYIPGGFSAENPLSFQTNGQTRTASALYPSEGIYIRTRAYAERGHPPIASAADIPYTIRSYCNRPSYTGGIPVVFGINGTGAETLAHLFGLSPEICQAVDISADLPDAFTPLLQFFQQLGKAGVTEEAFTVQEHVLETYLQHQALFYIGDSDAVEWYNLNHPDDPFIPLDVVLHPDGFLQAQSPLGSYATFLTCSDSRKDSTSRLVSYLLAPEGSHMTMFGIQNTHWLSLPDDTVLLFPDCEKNMIAGDGAFMKQTGIGIFPYLSRDGAVYPGKTVPTSITVRDILPEQLRARIDPTSPEGYRYTQITDKLLHAYRAALASGDS